MSDREAADAIIENFDGKKLPGATMPLQVRYADSPSQKRITLNIYIFSYAF